MTILPFNNDPSVSELLDELDNQFAHSDFFPVTITTKVDPKLRKVIRTMNNEWFCCGGIPIDREKNCPICGSTFED